jgi:uncharacterized membrane protein YoaK (UPF0700 family)
MTRSIGAVSHGILDYALAIILAVGPAVAGFTGRQARWAYIFAAILFVLALLTQVRFVRLPVHAAVELLLAILLILMPWIGNFSRGVNSRNFYVTIGLLMIVLWALTDFRGRRGAPVAGRESGPGGGGP